MSVLDGLPLKAFGPAASGLAVDKDGELFVERLRVIAEQFLAILPHDTPVAPPDLEA